VCLELLKEKESKKPVLKPSYTAALRRHRVELAIAGRGLKQLSLEFGTITINIREVSRKRSTPSRKSPT